MKYDMIVIGGGPAGLAAALSAWEAGCRSVLIVERDKVLGGILNQCIHNGFGLHYFKEELTGPEYAERFIRRVQETGIEVKTDTMVLRVEHDRTVHVLSTRGYEILEAEAVVLSMGCRERTRGAIAIPGSRPAGIFTAGAAQRYLNIEGYMVGHRVVILGSGDIGLIMARRLTLSGAEVLACVEVMPYSGGLTRNIVQCLQDFHIPLLLSHTITEIRGDRRVEQVVVSAVDERRSPIPGTEVVYDCDTVLLSVGLIPENELSRAAGVTLDGRSNGPAVDEDMETSIPGIFACGNVVHVHDLVDFVTEEGQRAGLAAARFCLSGRQDGQCLPITTGPDITYSVPQRTHTAADAPVSVSFRVRRIFGASRILVSDETGRTLVSFRRSRMAPGEMEKIQLKPEILRQAAGELRISVEEDAS